MNLRVLKRTRRPPVVGDVFAMLPPDNVYLFGRVIDTDVAIISGFSAVLIYIYMDRSPTKGHVPLLRRERLLVPPILTNRRPWTMGYFEHVLDGVLGADDRLGQHCFARYSAQRAYFDERGRKLPGPVDPVGVWGVGNHRTIDDDVSRALGIPMAPD